MFFHCLAMLASLAAMLLARRPASFEFSYGYDRFEVLAAFAACTCLIFVRTTAPLPRLLSVGACVYALPCYGGGGGAPEPAVSPLPPALSQLFILHPPSCVPMTMSATPRSLLRAAVALCTVRPPPPLRRCVCSLVCKRCTA
jgi:hypothetical protein